MLFSKATLFVRAAIARNDWERDAMGREALDFDAVCYFESIQRNIELSYLLLALSNSLAWFMCLNTQQA